MLQIVSPTRGEGWMKLEVIRAVFGGERAWKFDDQPAASRVEFSKPVYIGTVGFEDNRAHAGNFKIVDGVMFGDSGGNMQRLGAARDTIFTSTDLGRSFSGANGSNAHLFPLDGRQMFAWPGGKVQCIATGMCSPQPLTDLLTAGGIRNATVAEVAADGKLQKRQVTLPTPIRLLGCPDWQQSPKQFGGSMVVHTLSDGSVLMTFTVGISGSGTWTGGNRMSLISAKSVDGGNDFHFSAVIANASWFAGSKGNSARQGTITGPTEHDVVELPGSKHLMAVWRMGAGDGCGQQQFNISFCLEVGGYMPYWKAYSSNRGSSWARPQPIAKVDPPGCARPWMLALGNMVLLSGGRQRFANTTDVSLWASSDGGNGWTRYSLSGWHNMLVQNTSYGGLPAKFDAHVNSTHSPRETSSYTSLLRLPGDAGAIVTYDKTVYEFPNKPPASPFTGKNFNRVSLFAMRLAVKTRGE